MKALIPVGSGTRMGGVLKPTLLVQGERLVDRQLRLLELAGITEVHFLVNAHQKEWELEVAPTLKATSHYAENKYGQMISGLYPFLDVIAEDHFFMLYCDVLMSPRAMMDIWYFDHLPIILGVKRRYTDDLTDEKMKVIISQCRNKLLRKSEFVEVKYVSKNIVLGLEYVGALKCSKLGAQRLADEIDWVYHHRRVEYLAAAISRVATGPYREVYGRRVRGPVWEIDTPEDLERVNKELDWLQLTDTSNLYRSEEKEMKRRGLVDTCSPSS
jgi:choline kinase